MRLGISRGGRALSIALAVGSLLVSSGGVFAFRSEVERAPRAGVADRADAALRPLADSVARGLVETAAALREESTVPSAACGSQSARLVRFRVSVQEGLRTTATAFARAVRSILCDPRGWASGGRVRFAYDPKASVLVELLDRDRTTARCLALTGLNVWGKWSCAGASRAVLNADRWFGGSPTWPGPAGEYRAMLVNHEVGHVLGFGHSGCPSRGARAPVMMQQSKGLFGCVSNEWPAPAELRRLR